jgi:hypothetical protein
MKRERAKRIVTGLSAHGPPAIPCSRKGRAATKRSADADCVQGRVETSAYHKMLRRCSTRSAMLWSGGSNATVRATDGMTPPMSILGHRDAGDLFNLPLRISVSLVNIAHLPGLGREPGCISTTWLLSRLLVLIYLTTRPHLFEAFRAARRRAANGEPLFFRCSR